MNRVPLYVAVGLGGLVGSVLRYLLSILFTFSTHSIFPWATLVVNIVGTFMLAYILFHKRFKEKWPPLIFVGITTGVIGSFTTLSTVTFQIFELWQDHVIIAVIYTCTTVFGGLYVAFLGYKLANYQEGRPNNHVH